MQWPAYNNYARNRAGLALSGVQFYVMRSLILTTIALAGFILAQATSTPRSDGAALRLAQENDIREAVFRYQFRHNASILGQKAAVYCLSIGENGADPSDEFMRRFTGLKQRVRKVSECNIDSYSGVVEKRTGKRGLLLGARDIKWISGTEVQVAGGYFEDGLSATHNTYTLRKTQGKWRVTDDWITRLS